MLGPTQTGSTVTLAPIGPDHLEAYCRWFADPVVARFLARETPPTVQQEQEWLQRIAASEDDVVWGLFVDGQHVGSTGIHQINWRQRRALTGTLIGDRNWWGRGIGGESMRLRTRFAFEELNLEKLVTQVVEGNLASRKALEHVGYRTVGIHRRHEYRHGQWWDVWIGELMRDDWQPGSSQPGLVQ